MPLGGPKALQIYRMIRAACSIWKTLRRMDVTGKLGKASISDSTLSDVGVVETGFVVLSSLVSALFDACRPLVMDDTF